MWNLKERGQKKNKRKKVCRERGEHEPSAVAHVLIL